MSEDNRNIIALDQIEPVPDGIDFDLMVYNYHTESYEGSGFAAWKKGDEYFYHEMGHCSCNGPWDRFESSAKVAVTLDQLKLLIKNYDTYAKDVIAKLESLCTK